MTATGTIQSKTHCRESAPRRELLDSGQHNRDHVHHERRMLIGDCYRVNDRSERILTLYKSFRNQCYKFPRGDAQRTAW